MKVCTDVHNCMHVALVYRRICRGHGLEGVLALADSISLKDRLAAADLDSSAHDKATPTTKEAVVQSVEELVAEAASIV